MSHAPEYPLPHWTLVGFTGHREIHEPEAVARAIGTVIDRLATSHGPIAGVTSLASGADTLFVEQLALRRIPYFLILPFPEDRFRQDFSEADWQRIQPLLNQAIHITHAAPAQTAEEAYLDTGILTVNEADVMLAVWNGNPGKAGGTAEVTAYARATGNPLIIIDPHSRQITEERMKELPVRASRPDPAVPLPAPRASVEECFKKLDHDATTHGPTARQQVLRMILLHLAAAAVALVPLTFQRHGIENTIAIALEVVFLIAALLIAFRHRHTHHAWLRTRIDAELCRSFLSLWHFRRPGAALPGKGNIQDALSHDLYRSLRIMWFLDPAATLSLEAARDHYLQNRLNHQLRYFTEKGADAQRFGRMLKTVASVGTILSIIAGQLALTLTFMHHQEPDYTYASAKLLSLLLPIFSAGILTFAAANDWSRRAERFAQMTEHLQQAAGELLTARTWPGLWRTIARTEEFLLLEVIEWQAVSRYTGESH